MKHSVITLSLFYSSLALWLFCIQFQLQTREAELSGSMIKSHCFHKKEKKGYCQQQALIGWMGQRDSLFPLQKAGAWGKGTQGESGSPTMNKQCCMCAMAQEISWENCSKIFWHWKWVARTIGSTYSCQQRYIQWAHWFMPTNAWVWRVLQVCTEFEIRESR